MTAKNRTYFISDAHLGARYVADAKAHERRVCSFLKAIAPTAKRLIMLGDILDYWYEYKTVVPRGNVRLFGALAELSDSGTEITWITGNHDIWLFDYLRDEIGIRVIDPKEGYILEHIDGSLFCMAHGDRIGSRRIGFRLIQSLFRSKACQRLFSAIHPRWTIPFAHGWSNRSRKDGGANPMSHEQVAAELKEFALGLLSTHPQLRYVVIGHHHFVLDEEAADGCRVVILGDWLERSTYGVFDGTTLLIRDFSTDGLAE